MLTHPQFDPVALSLGPLQVHWYGVMYLIGFILAWYLGQRRAAFSNGLWQQEEVADLIFYGALGVVLGGRLGYMLFYYYPSVGWHDPFALLRIWQGGMSFHGGLLGVMAAMWWFGRKMNKDFLTVMDFLAPLVPLGLAMGRIGNFINGELWGRVSDVPWAMVFPQIDGLPRHPSQLYEALLEGFVLFFLLWIFSSKARPKGATAALFLIGYAIFRSLVEFFRQPDQQLGYLFAGMTMGQLLSLPLLLLGLALMVWAYRTPTSRGE